MSEELPKCTCYRFGCGLGLDCPADPCPHRPDNRTQAISELDEDEDIYSVVAHLRDARADIDKTIMHHCDGIADIVNSKSFRIEHPYEVPDLNLHLRAIMNIIRARKH